MQLLSTKVAATKIYRLKSPGMTYNLFRWIPANVKTILMPIWDSILSWIIGKMIWRGLKSSNVCWVARNPQNSANASLLRNCHTPTKQRNKIQGLFKWLRSPGKNGRIFSSLSLTNSLSLMLKTRGDARRRQGSRIRQFELRRLLWERRKNRKLQEGL